MYSRPTFMTFLQQPSELAELQAGKQVFAREEVQSFLYSIRSVSDKDAVLHDLAPLLTASDSFRAGMLAMICGGLVEMGGDLSIVVNGTLDLLVRQLCCLKDYVRMKEHLSAHEMFLHFPEAMRAHAALPLTIPAAMTMLCRDKEARMYWQRRKDLLDVMHELADTDEIPFYLRRTLSLLDDQELVVLDQLNKRGFLVCLVGVQDVMYHCYALLQDTILQHTGPGYLDAEPTEPEAVRYAQNYQLTKEDYLSARGSYDYQRFGFNYPGGLFFAGSASFYDLPKLDGIPFLMIEKKFMTFQWEPANMYPVLHESLASRVNLVHEMASDEVDAWLKRIFN
ncbi:hypothetical protein KDA_58300 [Dictyobacter alpinus]|uniref:Uncharacterized protein n=1 Tax=Dictyobacter alpinus TaxID=2014873 RepID=A0A402BG08_9CHLR|nr:hypothetical protein [Dictyobacter alpinus]GCE30314.1 hypothetical protein KDA_57980 [Dictyobacter alpinus]GCE30346.1 hypothetical protein KDA_58300 [Dictyobacter alpinus]